MLRINTVSLYVAAVLAFGLVSCGQKEKTKVDTYRAPAPRIIRSGQSTDLGAWEKENQRTLDIFDALDVRESGSVRVEISVACRRGQQDSQKSTITTESQPIPLFQFLPEELLVADLKAGEATCALKLTLKNQHGSQHIFNIAHATIREERPANLEFERNNGRLKGVRERFHKSQLAGIQIRSPGNAMSSGRILCQDAATSEMPVGEVARLADFDFDRMNAYQGRSENILQVNPVQLCRAFFAYSNLTQAITPLFEMQFDRQPLKIRPLALFNRNDRLTTLEIMGDPLNFAFEGRPITMATYVIENPSAISRVIQIPRGPLNVQIAMLMSENEVHTISRPFLSLQYDIAKEDLGSHYKMVLAPKAHLNINVIFHAPHPGCYNVQGNAYRNRQDYGMAVDFPQPLTVEELSNSGESLGTYSSDLGPRFYLGTSAVTLSRRSHLAKPNICKW